MKTECIQFFNRYTHRILSRLTMNVTFFLLILVMGEWFSPYSPIFYCYFNMPEIRHFIKITGNGTVFRKKSVYAFPKDITAYNQLQLKY